MGLNTYTPRELLNMNIPVGVVLETNRRDGFRLQRTYEGFWWVFGYSSNFLESRWNSSSHLWDDKIEFTNLDEFLVKDEDILWD